MIRLITDGGGAVGAALDPIVGADAVARFLVEILAGDPAVTATVASVNGEHGLLLRRSGTVIAVICIATGAAAEAEAQAENITDIWVVANPDKLRAWEGRH